MKAKIDLEKFICSYVKWSNIQDALKDQGLKCWNGEIVEISQESEDERIRKALIRYHKSTIDIDGIKGNDIIAWLEKQAEKKEISITIPDNLVGTDMDGGVIGEKGEDGMKPQVDGFDAELNALLKKYEYLPKEELAECLSFYLGVVRGNECDEEIVEAMKNASILDLVDEQKPKWSDADEELLQHCCGAIAAADYYTMEDKDEMENWLKAIKKKMEEQQ